jgi:hypothetical protein
LLGEQLLGLTHHSESRGVSELGHRRAAGDEQASNVPARVADGVISGVPIEPFGVSKSAPPSMSAHASYHGA